MKPIDTSCMTGIAQASVKSPVCSAAVIPSSRVPSARRNSIPMSRIPQVAKAREIVTQR